MSQAPMRGGAYRGRLLTEDVSPPSVSVQRYPLLWVVLVNGYRECVIFRGIFPRTLFWGFAPDPRIFTAQNRSGRHQDSLPCRRSTRPSRCDEQPFLGAYSGACVLRRKPRTLWQNVIARFVRVKYWKIEATFLTCNQAGTYIMAARNREGSRWPCSK